MPGVGRRARTGEVVAVLFDADNIPPAKAGAILASAARLGSLCIVRAYGDFFQPQLAGWRHAVTAHAILARQVTTVTRGKNTVDHAIVADAITIAHTTPVTTVVIASSFSELPHPDRVRTTLREDTRTRCQLATETGTRKVGQVTTVTSSCSNPDTAEGCRSARGRGSRVAPRARPRTVHLRSPHQALSRNVSERGSYCSSPAVCC